MSDVPDKIAKLIEGEKKAFERRLASLRHLDSWFRHSVDMLAGGAVLVFDKQVLDAIEANVEINPIPRFREASTQAGWLFCEAVRLPPGTWFERRAKLDQPVIHLKVPGTKRTKNLVAGLLIGATPIDAGGPGVQRMIDHDLPLGCNVFARSWDFFFRGDVGQQLFDAWADQCVSDPVFRAVRSI